MTVLEMARIAAGYDTAVAHAMLHACAVWSIKTGENETAAYAGAVDWRREGRGPDGWKPQA